MHAASRLLELAVERGGVEDASVAYVALMSLTVQRSLECVAELHSYVLRQRREQLPAYSELLEELGRFFGACVRLRLPFAKIANARELYAQLGSLARLQAALACAHCEADVSVDPCGAFVP